MDENRSMVPLYTAEMVQVYDLPTSLRLDKVIQYIVNFIEKALQPFFSTKSLTQLIIITITR